LAKSFSRAATVAALTLSFAAGCTPLDNALASVPYLAFMRNAPSFDPYEAPLNAPPGSIPFQSPAGAYLPPMEGTEAAINAFAASPAGRNPYAADDSAVLSFGQRKYEQHCAVCHNADGHGNGPIVGPGKFPMGPTLVGSTALGRSDGYIYGIIRAGRTLMPSYGARTTHAERWAIATYVKHLQAQATAGQAPTQPAAGPTPAQPAATQAAPAPAGGQTAPAAAQPGAGQETR
jgi:mono/diheme cytochrome c family protein